VSKIAVLGSGSWGTAFGMVLADAGNEVALWSRRSEVADTINRKHENPDYLPGIVLPDAIWASTEAAAAIAHAEFIVFAIPAQTLRGHLTQWTPLLPSNAVMVSLMKGIELGASKRMSEVIREVAKVPETRVAVLTGPNLAWEIAQRQPAASVIACADGSVASRLQAACRTGYFRPYTNADVVGCELGGAVKNVIALAVGIADGMGFGDNAKASLITRGLAETARLGAALGADPHTFSGLAGLGDLVATCSSPLSRNHTFGENLGRGMALADVVAVTRQTAEGVKSCQSILALATRHDIAMPITEAVVGVVHHDKAPRHMLRDLMDRAPKPERISSHA